MWEEEVHEIANKSEDGGLKNAFGSNWGALRCYKHRCNSWLLLSSSWFQISWKLWPGSIDRWFEFDDNGWMKRRVPIGSELVKQKLIIRRISQPVRIIFGIKRTSWDIVVNLCCFLNQRIQAALSGVFHISPCRYFFPADRLRTGFATNWKRFRFPCRRYLFAHRLHGKMRPTRR